MSTKTKSKSVKWWMNQVASLGCIACRISGIEGTPAVLHHIREGQGMSQRAPDMLVIPLCPYHHTDGPGSVHKNPRAFEARYGAELDLLAQTIEDVVSAARP